MPTAAPLPHTSCSAQTLRRVSSFGAVLRKKGFNFGICFCKRIGGSRETPAYIFCIANSMTTSHLPQLVLSDIHYTNPYNEDQHALSL